MALNLDVLDFLDERALIIVKANVDALLAVDGVSILAVALSDHELGEVSISLLNLGAVLVDTLGLQPVR